MSVLGYIVSQSKIHNLLPNIAVVKDISEVPDGSQTLIVGYGKAKSMFPNVNILERRIDDNTGWTFSKTEKRECFEKEVYGYQKGLYKKVFEGSEYIYINVFSLSISKLKHLVGVAKNGEGNYYYINGDMVYMCQNGNNRVFGVSLYMLRYGGVDPHKVIRMITSNKRNIVKFRIADVMTGAKDIRCKNHEVPLLMRFADESKQ